MRVVDNCLPQTSDELRHPSSNLADNNTYPWKVSEIIPATTSEMLPNAGYAARVATTQPLVNRSRVYQRTDIASGERLHFNPSTSSWLCKE